MDVKTALKGQYHGALMMLRQAIERCPDMFWTFGDYPRIYWRIAYHALYFTHFYLQPDADSFQRWEEHRPETEFLGGVPWPPHDMPKVVEPYSRAELLTYWKLCNDAIDAGVDNLDLDALECGFPWYKLTKLEHQILNIRHLQQHVGQLAEILAPLDIEVDWIGSGI